MGTIHVLDRSEATEGYLDAIVAATDQHSHELGFLPRAVYEGAVAQGKIWVAVSGREYCGHLFFAGVLPTLKVQQLFVCSRFRKRGIARRLINALVRYGEACGYGSIRARVAEDLDANTAWERLGFEVVNRVAGGRTTGRQLLVRFRRLTPRGRQVNFLQLIDQGARSARELLEIKALGLPVSGSACYTLDVNVWLDFIRERGEFGEMAQALIRQASRTGLRLRITDAFREEALRTSAERRSDPLLRMALEWPRLSAAETNDLGELITELRALILPDRSPARRHAEQDVSDLRHLALTITSNASGFVTRDGALLRARQVVAEKYGLDIVSPADLIEVEHEDIGAPPLGLDRAGSGLRLAPLTGPERRDGIRFIDAFRAGEGHRHERLDPESEGRLGVIEDQVVGAVHWPTASRQSPQAELLVAGSNSLSFEGRRQVFDILVGWLLLQARPADGMRRVVLRVDLETMSDFGPELERMGFFPTRRTGDLVRFLLGPPLGIRWPDIARDVHREFGATSRWIDDPADGTVLCLQTPEGERRFDRFSFETHFGLTCQTLAGRRAWYVPIKPHFRDELLPLAAQQALFRQRDAVFRVERVYFCSPTKPIPEAGDILLLYTSKPGSVVTGIARCTVGQIVDLDEARSRFARLAVIQPDAAARDGKVKCIAFDNYTPVSPPIGIRKLRAINAYPRQGPVKTVELPPCVSVLDVLAAAE